MEHRFLKPHHESEVFDEVKITTVSKWRENEFPGEGWRKSAHLQLLWKGNVLFETTFKNVETAAAFLPSLFISKSEAGQTEPPRNSKDYCDQPGCANEATVEYDLKQEYDIYGHGWPSTFPKYRRFCDKHARRGNSNKEDSDNNYTRTTCRKFYT